MPTETGEVGFLCIHVVHVEPCRLYFLMYRGGDPPNPPFVHGNLSPKIPNFGSVYLEIGPWDFQSFNKADAWLACYRIEAASASRSQITKLRLRSLNSFMNVFNDHWIHI